MTFVWDVNIGTLAAVVTVGGGLWRMIAHVHADAQKTMSNKADAVSSEIRAVAGAVRDVGEKINRHLEWHAEQH